jgi:Holliday junction resolvase
MSRQKAGLNKEHGLASGVYEATGGSVIPLRAGWSGNSAVPAPDLLIPYKGSLRALELFTSNQKRYVVDQEKVKDVVDWSMNMNEIHTFPYLSVKFSYYEMQTYRLEKPWDIEESFEIIDQKAEFDTNVTRSGNISFGHPRHYDCDVVGSNASPGDAMALLRDLRADKFANVESADLDTVGVYEVVNSNEKYWERMKNQ